MVVNGRPVWLSDIGLPLARSCRGLPDHQLSQQNHRFEVAEEIARRSDSAATRPLFDQRLDDRPQSCLGGNRRVIEFHIRKIRRY